MHLISAARGSLGRPFLDALSRGILYQETVGPYILCSTPVTSAPCTPAPARTRRQQIGGMKRVVRQRRDRALSLERPPALLQSRKRGINLLVRGLLPRCRVRYACYTRQGTIPSTGML
eukprot:1057692-Pyramimonas_sp.AAC.1